MSKFLFIIALISIHAAEAMSAGPPDYQTECVSLSSDGYVIIKVWNVRKGVKYKLKQARKDALKTILYVGIAPGGSCMTQSPLLNNNEERQNFNAIYKSFFSWNGDWLIYTNSANSKLIQPYKEKSKKIRIYEIAVAKNQLRKNLEENNIIKKINYGF
jgi:hypothetical protein